MAEPPVLALKGVWKRFGRDWVLRDVSLAVTAGEAVALLGPNGVGKTTLLRVAATLTRPQRGEVRLFGKPARGLEAERGWLLYVANPPAFYRHFTGLENLRYGLALMERPRPEGELREALLRYGLPPDKPVAAYSSGMKKRLALARAELLRPRLLLLDEPETALDEAGRAALFRLIEAIRSRGAVVLATHDRGFARRAAVREVVMT